MKKQATKLKDIRESLDFLQQIMGSMPVADIFDPTAIDMPEISTGTVQAPQATVAEGAPTVYTVLKNRAQKAFSSALDDMAGYGLVSDEKRHELSMIFSASMMKFKDDCMATCPSIYSKVVDAEVAEDLLSLG